MVSREPMFSYEHDDSIEVLLWLPLAGGLAFISSFRRYQSILNIFQSEHEFRTANVSLTKGTLSPEYMPMIRKYCVFGYMVALILSMLMPASAEDYQDQHSVAISQLGDRVVSGETYAAIVANLENKSPAEMSLARDTYLLGPGDVLSVNVQGRSVTNYMSNGDGARKDDPSVVTVSATGFILLPFLGNISAAGKTTAQLESDIHTGLSKYFKHFTVSLLLTQPRPSFVWIVGGVANAGHQPLPIAMTVSQSVLYAGVLPNGSVRRVELTRGNKKQTFDLYRILVMGDMDSDITLQPGDKLYVPPVTKYVEVDGEVTRRGRYEMVTYSGDTEPFRVRDLLQLSLGATPSAALDKAFIERIGPEGKKVAINIDLSGLSGPSDMDITMNSGDVLVVPSISAYQPIIRMIGEFKGDGVYQRALPSDNTTAKVEIQNKSGIYYLKQGQTAGDVILATGGVTPQADLKRAHIERREGSDIRNIPIDLERLLVKGEKAADLGLVNGDSLVMPAVADKVYVFGEVKSPGSYSYSPNRRLVDYVGDAGGPSSLAKLKEVRIIRGRSDAAQITQFNLQAAMKGQSAENSPVLEAGDIVFVPGKVIGGWRDAVQLVFTGLSLTSLLR